MRTELTNLLSPAMQRDLRRAYFLRLATVSVILILILIFVHAILLGPSFLYARAEAAREQATLDALAQTAQASGTDAETQVARVKGDIAYLARLDQLPTGSGAIRGVLSVPHPGIALTGFTFTAPGQDPASAKMAITGRSATRDALRQYALSLGQLPYVAKADLPISAYAKETDIPFTITLTGTMLP